MLSQRRSRPLARPRQIAMYLAKKMTSRSLPEIGRRFANRDNTTVIHAVKTISRLTDQDDEMKKNINQIKEPLNIVNNLTGVTFDWKDTDKTEIGLIAEEVHKVLPEIVAYQEGQPAALDYPKLTALLIECVKELQTKIDFLEKKFLPHDIDIKEER